MTSFKKGLAEANCTLPPKTLCTFPVFWDHAFLEHTPPPVYLFVYVHMQSHLGVHVEDRSQFTGP